jgi:uncharacterized protein YrrD
MEIPTEVDVICSDGLCGHSTVVIVNPVTEQLTHIVVRENHAPHVARLVPLEFIESSTPDQVRLRCTRAELEQMDPFVETEFLKTQVPRYSPDPLMVWPFVSPAEIATPENRGVIVHHEHIPRGELAVRRGARVEAVDGHVGQVDEFVVDSTSEHITHLVMREGHLWGHKDVTIPVSHIDRIAENTVYLKLHKSEVAALPAVPVRRQWL